MKTALIILTWISILLIYISQSVIADRNNYFDLYKRNAYAHIEDYDNFDFHELDVRDVDDYFKLQKRDRNAENNLAIRFPNGINSIEIYRKIICSFSNSIQYSIHAR